MQKKELFEKLSRQLGEQLDGFDITEMTVKKTFDTFQETINKIVTEETTITVRLHRCVYCKQRFTMHKDAKKNPTMIDGKPLCESCERMFRLQHEIAGINEHSTFEDYVISEIVIEEMALED